MKRIVKIMSLVALFAFCAMPADAQLGNLLKKVKKTVEAVTGTPDTPAGQVLQKTTAVPVPSGGTMENPLSSSLDIELVGVYGKTSSMNYGEVYLVMKVKMILNKPTVKFGGSVNNAKTMAVDQDGNSYLTKYSGVSTEVPVTEGMFVKVKLDNERCSFVDVKKSATTMQMIRIACWIDVDHNGMITFKNVPVKWDVEPE